MAKSKNISVCYICNSPVDPNTDIKVLYSRRKFCSDECKSKYYKGVDTTPVHKIFNA